TTRDLRTQAVEIASTIENLDDTGQLRVLANLRRALNLQGIEVVRFGPAGRTVDPLPTGVSLGDLDLTRLRAGQTLTGGSGATVFAAAPAPVTVTTKSQRSQVLAVVVLTRKVDALLRPAVGWFLVASIGTLLIGALVAWRFGRRLTRPVRQAEEAARRITAGDLSARVPIPLRDDKDEMSALLASINTMAEVLERSKGVERQFLLSVSHDLRTPLTSIRGYAEAIADGAIPDPASGGTVILSEARRLERLVGDLLDLAKLESRSFSLTRAPVDLVDVAAGTADGFRPEAADAGVTVEVLTPNDPVVVEGDADRLAQITANLVQNALKYARTRIRISVETANGWARLAVSDDGPGIAIEDLPHVFERLYVSRHQPQRKEVGSGLGLAIVRELATAMGGTVDASANAGGGACLALVLPLSSASTSSTTTSR
ncbi:MAG TPA: HAMP domain-containing sensor histidine kinase, partial [Acidimicrobiales bacterium]|nr:HAMP domain-containing sensor histidine kinase [Acidimicrobiales bacterium]